MRVSIKTFIFLFCLSVLLVPEAAGAKNVEAEAPQYRQYSSDKLEEYRSDSDYQYERGEYTRVSWWERFQQWLIEVLKAVFGAAPSGSTLLNILYLISALVLVWVITRLVGIDMNSLIKGERKTAGLAYRIREEKLHEIDFEQEMESARKKGKWRLLIRLQYLYALKKLGEQGSIQIKNGKTNQDYLYEISVENLREPFARLSRIFEYTWYGHFDVTPEIREQAEHELSTLKTKLAG